MKGKAKIIAYISLIITSVAVVFISVKNGIDAIQIAVK